MCACLRLPAVLLLLLRAGSRGVPSWLTCVPVCACLPCCCRCCAQAHEEWEAAELAAAQVLVAQQTKARKGKGKAAATKVKEGNSRALRICPWAW